MIKNGKRIGDPAVTGTVFEGNVRAVFGDIIRERKAKKRIEIENSQEYKDERQARELAQGFTSMKEAVVSDLQAVAKQISQEVFNYIAEEIGSKEKAQKKTWLYSTKCFR